MYRSNGKMCTVIIKNEDIHNWVHTMPLIFLVQGFYSYRNNRNFLATRQMVFHTMQVLSHIEQTNSNALRIEEGLSRFTVTGDSAVLMIYRRELQMATRHFIELLKLTKDNPSQLNRIDSLRKVGRKKIDLYEAVIASRDKSRQQETLIASPDNQVMSARVKTIVNGMRDDAEPDTVVTFFLTLSTQ